MDLTVNLSNTFTEEQQARYNALEAVIWLDKRREEPLSTYEIVELTHWVLTGEMPKASVVITGSQAGDSFFTSWTIPR